MEALSFAGPAAEEVRKTLIEVEEFIRQNGKIYETDYGEMTSHH